MERSPDLHSKNPSQKNKTDNNKKGSNGKFYLTSIFPNFLKRLLERGDNFSLPPPVAPSDSLIHFVLCVCVCVCDYTLKQHIYI
jgi:hypothetical protein